MDLLNLLNRPLKSKQLIQLFEQYDVVVTYSYDRLEENLSDQYYGSIEELGLEFRFNEKQSLETIYFYVNRQGDSEFSIGNNANFSEFTCSDDIQRYADRCGIPTEVGSVYLFGQNREWIKLIQQDYFIHYEFHDAVLKLITLQSTIHF